MNLRSSNSREIRGAIRLSRTVFGAMLATLAIAATTAMAAERPRSTPAVQRLPRPAFDALAARAEARLREKVKEPIVIDFHRSQSFRFGPKADATELLSLSWTTRDSRDIHCVFHLARGTQLLAVDPLDLEAEHVWSCDDPPAVKIADVDGDGCPDVLAMYPYRPPSNERFPLPLVFTCTPDRKGHQLDVERTNWLSAPSLHRAENMAQALRALDRFRAVPTH